MPANPLDIVAALPPLKWRGLIGSCISAPFNSGHEQAGRRYPYKDAKSHDNTGRIAYLTSVVLCFRNGQFGKAPGGKAWYPDYWADWKAALEDGSIGELEHPDLGRFDARVLTFSGDGPDAKFRDGINVTVQWEESVEDLTEQPQFESAAIDLETAAKTADAECAALGISYPDGQSETSIFEAVAAIEGAIFSFGLSVGGLINRTMGAVTSMFDSVEALGDPAAWPASDALLTVFAALRTKADEVAKAARSTAKATTTTDTTLDAFARQVGNTVTEIQELNLFALRSPIVAKGTALTYYTDK